MQWSGTEPAKAARSACALHCCPLVVVKINAAKGTPARNVLWLESDMVPETGTGSVVWLWAQQHLEEVALTSQ